jgi:hypothetical protein
MGCLGFWVDGLMIVVVGFWVDGLMIFCCWILSRWFVDFSSLDSDLMDK